jgi:hypothetical protein
MLKQISEERYQQLMKMINFLTKRGNVKKIWYSTSECIVEGYEVFCTKSQKLLAHIAINKVSKTHWFGEVVCK